MTNKTPAGNGSVFSTALSGTRYRLSNVDAARQTATVRRVQPKLSKAERKAAKRARHR